MQHRFVREKTMGGSGKRWAIFAILSSMFVLSMFYRVSNAELHGSWPETWG